MNESLSSGSNYFSPGRGSSFRMEINIVFQHKKLHFQENIGLLIRKVFWSSRNILQEMKNPSPRRSDIT
jgi:hypothetical protein